jgi:Mg2+-importing ATPase
MGQLRSPLLILLGLTAVTSFFVGERTGAVIIGVILAAAVGLGFVNEYRADRAAQALHSQVRHSCVVTRGGHPGSVDVTELVPGDWVDLALGEVVPADMRLVTVMGLECDESVLTGESVPVEKSAEAVDAGTAVVQLTCCALMGTVVTAGSGGGIVVATGSSAQFGRIAAGLGDQQPETEFQVGLRRFSMLLVQVAAVLTTAIFVVNVVLHRPPIDALLFSLAIAVGISPQLLPAVVSTSLATGSRRLAQRKVLVKRLVCIEDLGNIEVLFTDKTGTLTEGRITYLRAIGVDDEPSAVLSLGLLCNEAVVDIDPVADGVASRATGQVAGRVAGGNPLDIALWQAPAAKPLLDGLAVYRRLAILPFDHERRLVSVLVADGNGEVSLVVKGAPEVLLERCVDVSAQARQSLDTAFAAGYRVIAVATRPFIGARAITADDERELRLRGFLVFIDAPKASASGALRRLTGLGVTVKVVTGDNPLVAATVCDELGLAVSGVATGSDIDAMDDQALAAAVAATTIFARVGPEHKARIVRVQRRAGVDVAFLGDGVNDALALHAADIGISVESATDVAKDAADIILLDKDLDVLADGVVEGRRIFANTMKYVLMGTSSNFGNMFSAAGASAFLAFLPMLPSQILLNNLLYDSSQLAIPTDNVDEEQLARPARWDIHFIRRFMLFFGPLSSVFDFATFGVMLLIFHAHAPLFRSGWFVESLATQALVIFAIRTRRVPFLRSRPSAPLAGSVGAVMAVATVLPATPVAHMLGFTTLPWAFFLALALLVGCYLVLIEVVKGPFYRALAARAAPAAAMALKPALGATRARRIHRRAARFSTAAGGFRTPDLRRSARRSSER